MKKPKIFEETEDYIEVEIPEGKSEEYNLEGYYLKGNGGDFRGNYFEYYRKNKTHDLDKR